MTLDPPRRVEAQRQRSPVPSNALCIIENLPMLIRERAALPVPFFEAGLKRRDAGVAVEVARPAPLHVGLFHHYPHLRVRGNRPPTVLALII